MGFADAIATCFQKYVVFSGRARRPEYWYWVLFSFLLGILLVIIDLIVFGGSSLFSTLVSLALFLPSLAVAIRRLHDIDRVGWWILIALVPLVGSIILIVMLCQRGTAGPNRFGLEPVA
jgi:uncharacterized membrane protein YhaH (DUF805 family)